MSIRLHDFVKQTLLDITNAVHAAQQQAPHWIAPGHVEGKPRLEPQMIEFSIQVSASESMTQKGEGEFSAPIITIVKAGISAKMDSSNENQTTQSLKFSVPVYFQSPKREIEA